ncbi:enoyl reductase [Exophiala aquamarina CBS 119918]|uniref:very-long-chain enoyl-CoA reductase n=1 Tax=Exophiala aquamarina CBS 119918 TaxID=1182545 RepID=A0A072PQN1_9EURO|nr:enoyl reductase [Exophiala aquamarina CBS 119918]KEF57790.1 enoyl reductase [Exophiala aquamarina CBS 119918]
MSSTPITLQIRPRGKPIKALPESIELDPNATTAEIYSKLSQETRFSVHQLRVTKGSDGTVITNSKDVSAHATGLRNQSTVYVKDLGTQIAWRTVFIVEYVGPILIHPLVYTLRPYVYPSAPKEPSQLQTVTLWLVVLHFIKRELETLFIHRFSAATMPLRNIFKNSFHYWILSGVLIAAFVYAPSSATAKAPNPLLLYPGLVLYTIGELGNLQSHLTLMGLRSSGGTERGIPQGPLFRLVTCPNYLTETVSWIGVYLVSGLSWGVLIFSVISVAQMAQWAKKKERRYRKEFGDKYKKKRYTMLPGIW